MRIQTGKLLWILWSAKIFQTLLSPFQICSVSLYETRHLNNQSIQSVVDRHYHFHLSRLNMISWSWYLQVQHPIIDQKIHFSENDILSLVGHIFRYLFSRKLSSSICITSPKQCQAQDLCKWSSELYSVSCVNVLKKFMMYVVMKRRNWEYNTSILGFVCDEPYPYDLSLHCSSLWFLLK